MRETKTGRIIKALSGFYYIPDGETVTECRARGKLRMGENSPLVGDGAVYSVQNGKGVIEELLPRRNSFFRPAVANIDLLVIFASGAIPVTDPFLIDRVTAVAEGKSVPVLLCINKTDLDDGASLFQIYKNAGFEVLATSAVTGEGIAQLREKLRGKLAAFTGNSGVGKSSVLNCLSPALSLPTGEVSEKLGRGRHTTRHVELYSLGENTYVVDTPGFSSFDTEQAELIRKEDLQYTFPEFAPFSGTCQFRDCTHRKEPGCTVREALLAGRIEKTRYQSYLRLYEAAAELPSWELK